MFSFRSFGILAAMGETPFYYCHDAPMSTHPDMTSTYTHDCFTYADVARDEVFAQLQNGSGDVAYQYVPKLGELAESIVRQALPLRPLMVLAPTFNATSEYAFRQTIVWLSQPNTTTPCTSRIRPFFVFLSFLLFLDVDLFLQVTTMCTTIITSKCKDARSLCSFLLATGSSSTLSQSSILQAAQHR